MSYAPASGEGGNQSVGKVRARRFTAKRVAGLLIGFAVSFTAMTFLPMWANAPAVVLVILVLWLTDRG